MKLAINSTEVQTAYNKVVVCKSKVYNARTSESKDKHLIALDKAEQELLELGYKMVYMNGAKDDEHWYTSNPERASSFKLSEVNYN